MTFKKLTKKDLIDYFFRVDDESRPVTELNHNLDAVLKEKLNMKELALVLFHSALHGSDRGVYGEQKIARRVIENHIQGWTDKVLRQQEGHTAYTLSHMLLAFSILKMRPPERLVKFLEPKITQAVSEMHAKDMRDTLKSLATLGMPLDKGFFKAVQDRIPQIKHEFNGYDLYEVFHSLSILDAVGENLHGKRRAPLGNIFSPLLSDPQVRQKLVENDDEKTRRMLLDSVFWFKGQTPLTYTPENGDASLFETDVAAAFKHAGANLHPSEPHPVTKHRIDLKAAFGATSFAVECDGPDHFVRCVDSHNSVLNGNTIFQTALMARRDPDQLLIRLPYDVFYQNMDNHEMWQYLMIELEDVGTGNYIVGPDGNLLPLTAGFDPGLPYEEHPVSPSAGPQ